MCSIKLPENNTTLPLRKSILDLPPCVHGGLIRKNAQKYDIPESEILDFSANINPLGSPFEYPGSGLDLQQIMQKALERINQYPDNRYQEFRDAAACFLGMQIQAENIIPGNGSSEIIRLVAECIIEKGDMVIISQPTFDEYEQQCRMFGASFLHICDDAIFNVSDALLKKSKILFLCNPNNPTGKLVSRSDLIVLAQRCAENKTLLFVDEAFSELSDPAQSIADVAATNDYVFVLRSLTKSFAIPGIRMGFGVASLKMAELLNNARLSWNLGVVPEAIGTALLDMDGGCNSQYLIDSRELIKKERQHLMELFSRIRGFEPKPSSVNYIFVDVSDMLMDSVELTYRLASHGILIRDCSSFYSLGKDYIRIAVRTREENDRLAKSIGKVLTEWGKEQAEEKLKDTLKAASEGTLASRSTCEYYPCHFEGQDCTFCFCPFYPCEDERTGGKCIERSTGGRVWSCSDCNMIHKAEVSQKILDILMEKGSTEENLKEAWKRVVEPLL
ncbi:MAG: threonine-phosphate decarboxylase [Methanosarcinaceae archaeon]|nr:threonine-phosphate decarboxylase [Methanosarcinaceae archaeon]